MSHVLVIDQDKRPLDPIHPGYARKLLSSGQAAVYRHFPFVLILKNQVPEAHPQPLRLKIDPGSHTTGLAVLNDATGQVVWAAELTHRGEQVHARLQQRASVRRGRRSRHTRYRPARWRNRRRRKGWLPPSLCSRVQNQVIPLLIRAKGRQCRRMCNVDELGFPRSRPKGPSKVDGFQTGDMLRARVTKGKKSGSYVGWVAIKTDGYFKITGRHGMVEGIHARYCAPIHRDDGYVYTQGKAALPPLV